MSTILPKEPVITDRQSVILSNAERRNLRRKFKNSLVITRQIISPRHQLKRLVARKTAQTIKAADETVRIAKKNAPVIGAVGVSALLFAARGPISRWISGLRQGKTKTPDGN